MSVRRSTSGNITILKVGGEFFGGDETDLLRKAILDEAAGGNLRLLLDLSECSNMNSSGLAVMSRRTRTIPPARGRSSCAGSRRR